MDDRLVMSQQSALLAKKANVVLECTKNQCGQQVKGGDPSLHPALFRPQLEYCIQFWAPQYKKDRDLLERVQRRATKMIKGWVTRVSSALRKED